MAAAIFMGINMMIGKDTINKLRNALIEFGYCLTIYFIMTFVNALIGNILSGMIATVCGVIYLAIINPKYMGRVIFNPAR